MDGWETVLAAVGGLLLGAGAGVWIGRRHERRTARELYRVYSRLRASVIPVLEARAEVLGLSRTTRESSSPDQDPLTVSLHLGESIQRVEQQRNLAFSDTVEISRADLSGAEGEKR